MSEHPYRSQQSPERRRLRFLSWLTSRTRSGRPQWRALGDIASTSMLGIDGRMFVRFEAYRTTEGRQGWRRIMVEPNEELVIRVNRELLKGYMVAAEDLRNRTGGKSELDTVALLRLPGVIGDTASVFPDSEERQQELGQLLESLLQSALVRMDETRRAEGQRLTQELRSRVDRIADQCVRICDLVKRLRPAYARRLEVRLKELLKGTTLEPMRLAQEAALLAQRSDITEEIDRLQSHLTQFTKLLDDTGELGKKLDFLLQEMHREVNMMLSKTPGVESEALAITGLSLEIKADIEKLRESVQDIE